MDILTTVVFLLDVLEIQGKIKRKLHNKQIKKLEKLIKVLYQQSNQNVNNEDYIELYNIYKTKSSCKKNPGKKEAITKTIERIKYLLVTGEDQETTPEETNDKMLIALNKAYEFISQSVKDEINEILKEQLTEEDYLKLKTDTSENASFEIVKLYLDSKETKEEFCKRTFISYNRLNKAIAYILNSEEHNELKDELCEKEYLREEEIKLIEQVMLNYNRKEKNINLLEFQSLSSQTINRTLAILKERKSIAYPQLNELYREYQNRLRLAPFTFQAMRQMKTIVGGREMTNDDYDIIERFFMENNYPKQGAIFTYVRNAYLNGNLELVRRENLKKSLLERFGLLEKEKEKVHK